jgi:hypothetical protein
MSAFSVHPHIHAQVLNLSSESNNQDLKLYITHCMSMVTMNFPYLPLSTDWPGKNVIPDLVQCASGLFIWAFIACGFIAAGHDPREQLHVLQSSEVEKESDIALYSLYCACWGNGSAQEVGQQLVAQQQRNDIPFCLLYHFYILPILLTQNYLRDWSKSACHTKV